MGRKPKGYDVDYYMHEVGYTRKIEMVDRKYGNDGYATWFKIIDILCKSHLQAFDLYDENNKDFLSIRCNIETERLIEIINFLAKIGVFESSLWENYNILFNSKLVDGLSEVYRKRGIETPNIDNIVHHYRTFSEKKYTTTVLSAEKSTQSRVEESRGEESRVEEMSFGLEKPNLSFDILEFWNSQKIIHHRLPPNQLKCENEKYENILKKLNKSYTQKEIQQAILNYSHILKNESGEFIDVYKWTLPEFLKRGFEKYVDWDNAYYNKKKNKMAVSVNNQTTNKYNRKPE